MYCEHCGSIKIYKKGSTPTLEKFDKETGKPSYKSESLEYSYYCPHFECRNYEKISAILTVIALVILFSGAVITTLILSIGLIIDTIFLLSIIGIIILLKRHDKRSWIKKEYNK